MRNLDRIDYLIKKLKDANNVLALTMEPKDPNRLKPMLEKYLRIWQAEPDQRFGRIMWQFLQFCKLMTSTDPFNIEDAQMKEFLDKYEKRIIH